MANPTLEELRKALSDEAAETKDASLAELSKIVLLDENEQPYVDVYGITASNANAPYIDFLAKKKGIKVKTEAPSKDDFIARYKHLYGNDDFETNAAYGRVKNALTNRLDKNWRVKDIATKEGTFVTKDGNIARELPVNPNILQPEMVGRPKDGQTVLPSQIYGESSAGWDDAFYRMGVKNGFNNMTEQEIAEAAGVVVKRGAKPTYERAKRFNPETGQEEFYDKLKREDYYEDLNEYRSKDGWFNGVRNYYNNNGTLETLIYDVDAVTGQPTVKAVSADAVLKSDVLRSVFGPQKKDSSTVGHVFDSFYNGIVSAGSAVGGTLPNVAGIIGESIFGEGGASTFMKKWGQKNINYFNAGKFKVSESAAQEGIFDSFRGFAGTASDVAAQLAASMGAGYLARTIGAGATGVSIASRLMGAAQAGHAMNEEGIRMGIDEKSRAALTVFAGLAMAGSEFAMSKLMKNTGLIDRLGTKGANEFLKDTFQAAAKEEFEKVGAQIVGSAAMSAKTKIAEQAGKGVVAKVFDKIKAFANADLQNSPYKSYRVAGAMGEESGEEFIEGGITEAGKAFHDAFYALSGATPGDGKFGVGFNDILDDWAENLVGGMIGGALGGVVSSKPLAQTSRYRAAAQVVANSNDWKDVEDWATQTWQDGGFDNPFVTKDGEPLTEYTYNSSTGQNEKKSKNDIAKDAFMTQLKSMWDIKQKYGITSQEVMLKTFGSDTELVTQTLTALRVQEQHKEELALMQQQLSSPTLSEDNRKTIESQIESKKAEIEKHDKVINKVLSGAWYAEYLAGKALMANDFATALENKAQENVLKNKKAIDLDDLQKMSDEISPTETAEVEKRLQKVKDYTNKYQTQLKELASKTGETQAQVDALNKLANAKANDKGEYEGLEINGKKITTEAERKQEIETLVSNLNSSFQSPTNTIKMRLGADGAYQQNTDLHQEFEAAKSNILEQLNKRLQSYFPETMFRSGTPVKRDAITIQAFNNQDVVADEKIMLLEGDADKGQYIQDNKDQLEPADSFYSADVEGNQGIGLVEKGKVEDFKKDVWFSENGGLGGILGFGKKNKTGFEKSERVQPQMLLVNGNAFQILAPENNVEIAQNAAREKIKQDVLSKDPKATFEEKGDALIVTYSNGNKSSFEVTTAPLDLRVKIFFQEIQDLRETVEAASNAADVDGIQSSTIETHKSALEKKEDLVKTLRDLGVVAMLGKSKVDFTDLQKKHLGIDIISDIDNDSLNVIRETMISLSQEILGLGQKIEKNRDVRAENLATYNRESARINALLMLHLKESLGIKDYSDVGVEAPNDSILEMLSNENQDISALSEEQELAIYKAQKYWHEYFKKNPELKIDILQFAKFLPNGSIGAENRRSLGAMYENDGLLSINGIYAVTLKNFIAGKHNSVVSGINNPPTTDTGFWNARFIDAFLYNTFAIDPKVFLDTFYDAVNGNKKFGNAQTQEQINTAQLMFSHYAATDDFHSRIDTGIFDQKGTKNNKNAMAVVGPGGAGKTSFVLQTFLTMVMKNAANKKPAPLYVVAKYESQIEGLQRAAQNAGYPDGSVTAMTFDKFQQKDIEQDAIIVIDECSLLTEQELKGQIEKLSSNKLFLMGDPYQCPDNIDKGFEPDFFHLAAVSNINMTQIMRAEVTAIGSFQAALRSRIANPTMYGMTPLVSVFENDAAKKEVRGVQKMTSDEMLNEFISLVKENSAKSKVMYIVWDETDKQALLSKIGDQVKDADSYIYTMLGSQTPQGLTCETAFVDLSMERYNALLAKNANTNARKRLSTYYKYFLTATSRPTTRLVHTHAGESVEGKAPREVGMAEEAREKAKSALAEKYKKMADGVKKTASKEQKAATTQPNQPQKQSAASLEKKAETETNTKNNTQAQTFSFPPALPPPPPLQQPQSQQTANAQPEPPAQEPEQKTIDPIGEAEKQEAKDATAKYDGGEIVDFEEGEQEAQKPQLVQTSPDENTYVLNLLKQWPKLSENAEADKQAFRNTQMSILAEGISDGVLSIEPVEYWFYSNGVFKSQKKDVAVLRKKGSNEVIAMYDTDTLNNDENAKFLSIALSTKGQVEVTIDKETAQAFYTQNRSKDSENEFFDAADFVGLEKPKIKGMNKGRAPIKVTRETDAASGQSMPKGWTYLEVEAGGQTLRVPVFAQRLSEPASAQQLGLTKNAINGLVSFLQKNPAASQLGDLEKPFADTIRHLVMSNQDYLGKLLGEQALAQLHFALLSLKKTGSIDVKDKEGNTKSVSIKNEIGKQLETLSSMLNDSVALGMMYAPIEKNPIVANLVFGSKVSIGRITVKAVPAAKSETSNGSKEDMDAGIFNTTLENDDILISEADALEQIEKILGIAAARAVEITGLRFIEGDLILGEMRNGRVLLTNLGGEKSAVSQRTVWHEATHLVTEHLMTTAERTKLFDEIQKKTGKTGLDAKEWIAEEAERYNVERRNLKGLSKYLRKFFDFLKYFVADIFPSLKLQTDAFLYRVFDKRAYKDLQPADIYEKNGTLYNRVPQRITASFANDKQLALQALSSVAHHISKPFLRSNMDKQRIANAHKGINFIDLKNRVEYAVREELQDLFLTLRANGYLNAKGLNVTTQNGLISKITYKSEEMATPLTVFENGKPVHSAIVHSTMRGLIVSALSKLNVIVKEKNKTYAVAFGKMGELGKSALRAAASQTFSIMDEDGNGVAFEGFNLRNVFDKLVLLQGNNLENAMQYYFPNIDFRNLNARTNDAIGQFIAASDSIQALENHESSPMERQSDLLKMMLQTIPVRTVSYAGRNFTVPLADPTDIDVYMMEVSQAALLGDALDVSATERIANGLSAFLKSEEDEAKRASDEGLPFEHTEKYDVVKSIYDAIFSKEQNSLSLYNVVQLYNQHFAAVASGDADRIANAKQKIRALYQLHTNGKSNVASFEDYLAQLPHLAEQHTHMLNAIGSYYMSVAKDNYMSINNMGKVGVLNTDTEEKLAEQIKDKMATTFIQDGVVGQGFVNTFGIDTKDSKAFGGRGLSYNPSEAKRGTGNPFAIVGGANGEVTVEYYPSNNEAQIRLFSINQNGEVRILADLKAESIDRKLLVERIFASLGLNRPKAGTATRLSRLNVGRTGGGLEWLLQWYAMQLATTGVGAYQLAHNISEKNISDAVEQRNTSKELPSPVYVLASAATQFHKNNDAGTLFENTASIMNRSVDENNQAQQEDENETQQKVMFGGAFYKQIADLTSKIYKTETSRGIDYCYTPNGKKIYRRSIQDDTKKRYRGNTNVQLRKEHQKLVAGKRMANAEKLWQGLNEYEDLQTPDAKIVPLNPLLYTEEITAMEVTDIQYLLGIKTGMNNGKDISQLGEADNFDIADMLLEESVSSLQNIEKGFMVQLHNQSDRGRQKVFSVKLNSSVEGSNGIVAWNNGKPKMDSEALTSATANRFVIEQNAQLLSIARWTEALEYAMQLPGVNKVALEKVLIRLREFALTGSNISAFIPQQGTDMNMHEIEDAYQQYRTAVKDALKNLFEGIAQINALDASLKESFLQNSGIFGSRDYLQDGSNIMIGIETNMNDDIYLNGDSSGVGYRSPNSRFSSFALSKQYKDANNANKTVSSGAIIWSIFAKGAETFKTEAPQFDFKSFLTQVFKKDLDFAQSKAVENGMRSVFANKENAKLGRKKYGRWLGKGLGGYGKNQNELWIANNIAHILFNDFHVLATIGAVGNFVKSKVKPKSGQKRVALDYLQTVNKRSAVPSSPGMAPVIDKINGADTHCPALTMYSVKKTESFRLASETVKASVKVFDGMTFKTPFYMMMMEGAYGGKWGMGVFIKSTFTNSNIDNGSVDLAKDAAFTAYSDMLMDSPAWHHMLEICYNPAGKTGWQGATWSELNQKPEVDNMYARYLLLLEETRYNDRATELKRLLTDMHSSGQYTREVALSRRDVIEKLDVENKEEILERYFPVGIEQCDLAQINAKDYVNLALALFESEKAKYESMQLDDNAQESLRIVEKHMQEYKEDIETMPLHLLGNVKDATARLFHEYYKKQRLKNGAAHRVEDYYIGAIYSPDTLKQETAQRKQVAIKLFPSMYEDENGLGANENKYSTILDGVPSVAAINGHSGQDHRDKVIFIDNRLANNQLNPSKDTDDSDESPLTQLMAIILSNPEYQGAESLMNILKDYIADGVSDIHFSLLNKMVEAEDFESLKEKVKAAETDYAKAYRATFNKKLKEEPAALKRLMDRYIHNFVKERAAAGKDTSTLAQLLQSNKVGPNFGGMQMLIYRYLSAHIKTNAIKRKMSGMRLVQSAGNIIQVFDVNVGGKKVVMTLRDLATHAMKMKWLDAESFDYASFAAVMHDAFVKSNRNDLSQIGGKYTLFVSKMLDGTVSAPRELKKYEVDATDKNKMSVGEAVLPATIYEKAGISKSIGLQELFTTYTTLNGEVLAENMFDAIELRNPQAKASFIEKIKVKLMPSKNVSLNEKGEWVVNPEGFISNNAFARQMFYKSLKYSLKKANDAIREQELASGSALSMESKQAILREKVTGEKVVTPALILKYVEALQSVKATVEANLPVRTPSGPGSGALVNVVGFHNDDSSIGYFNSMLTYINGSDYDVDQVTAYFPSPSDYVLGKEGATATLEDRLFDGIRAYYESGQTAVFTLSKTDTTNIEDAGKEGASAALGDFNGAHNLAASFIMRNAAMGGKVVGPFANAQKGLTSIHTAWRANGQQGFNEQMYKIRLNGFDTLPRDIEELVNGATDNPKLMAMGSLGIIFENTDMLSAMVACANKDGGPSSFGVDLLDYLEKTNMATELGFNNAEDMRKKYMLAIFRFLRKSQAAKDIFRRISQAKRFSLGGQSKTLYHTALLMVGDAQSAKEKLESVRAQKNTSIDEALSVAQSLIAKIYTTLGIQTTPESINEYIQKFRGADGKITTKSINANLAELRKAVSAKNSETFANMSDDLYYKLGIADLDEKSVSAEESGEIETESYINQFDEAKNSQQLIKAFKTLILGNAEVAENVVEAQKAMNDLATGMQNVRYYLARAAAIQSELAAAEAKADDKYIGDLTMIGKFAMMGEWLNRFTKVVAINQGTKPEPFDQYKYINNLEFMFGVSLDQFYDLIEQFQAYKQKINPQITASEFLNAKQKEPGFEYLSMNARQNKAFEQYANRQEQGDVEWIDGTIGDPQNESLYLNFREQFHNIGDAMALVMSLPHISEMIKTIDILNSVEAAAFPKKMPVMQTLAKQIASDCGIDVLSQRQFIALENQIDAALMSSFFLQNNMRQKSSGVYRNFVVNMGAQKQSPWNGRLENAHDRNVFVTNAPDILKQMLDSDEVKSLKQSNDEINLFFNTLVFNVRNRTEYIEIGNMGDLDETTISRLQSGFNLLPQVWQDFFSLYQLAKDGFKYGQGNFSQILGVETYEQFSSYINSMYDSGTMFSSPQMFENLKMQVLENGKSDIVQRGPVRFYYDTEAKKTIRYAMPVRSKNGIAKYMLENKYPRFYKGKASYITYLTETKQVEGTISFGMGAQYKQHAYNVEKLGLSDNNLYSTTKGLEGLTFAADFLFFDERGPQLLDTLRAELEGRFITNAFASGVFKNNGIEKLNQQVFDDSINEQAGQKQVVETALKRVSPKFAQMPIGATATSIFNLIDKTENVSPHLKHAAKAEVVKALGLAYKFELLPQGMIYKNTPVTTFLAIATGKQGAVVDAQAEKDENIKKAVNAEINQAAIANWEKNYVLEGKTGTERAEVVKRLNELAEKKYIRLKPISALKYKKEVPNVGNVFFAKNEKGVDVFDNEAEEIIKDGIYKRYRLAYLEAVMSNPMVAADLLDRFRNPAVSNFTQSESMRYDTAQILSELGTMFRLGGMKDLEALKAALQNNAESSIYDVIKKDFWANTNARNQFDLFFSGGVIINAGLGAIEYGQSKSGMGLRNSLGQALGDKKANPNASAERISSLAKNVLVPYSEMLYRSFGEPKLEGSEVLAAFKKWYDEIAASNKQAVNDVLFDGKPDFPTNLGEIKAILNKLYSMRVSVDKDLSKEQTLKRKAAASKTTGHERLVLERVHGAPIEVGDTIYFADGFVGRVVETDKYDGYTKVTNEGFERIETDRAKEITYVIDRNLSRMQPDYESAITSLEQHIERYNVQQALTSSNRPVLIKTTAELDEYFRFATPEIRQKALSSDAFIYDGNIFINAERANSGTVIHELGHVLDFFLLSGDEELKDAHQEMIDFLMGIPELVEYIKVREPDAATNEDLLRREILPYFLQLAHYQKRALEISSADGASEQEKSLAFMYEKTVRAAVGQIFKTSYPQLQNATLLELADKYFEQMASEYFRGFELKTSAAYNRYQQVVLRAASTTGAAPINLGNVETVLSSKLNSTELVKARLVRSISDAINVGQEFRGPSGQAYSFVGLDDAAKQRQIAKIIKDEADFEQSYNNKFQGFMRALNDGSKSQPLSQYINEAYNVGLISQRSSQEDKTAFLDFVQKSFEAIGFNPAQDRAMTAQEYAAYRGISLKNATSESTIIVHDAGKQNERITVASFTKMPLAYGQKQALGAALGTEVVKNVSLKQTTQDLNAALNTMLVMMIQNANKSAGKTPVRVEKVASIGAVGENPQLHFKEVADVLPSIKAISKSILSKSIEPDLKSALDNETLYEPDLYTIDLMSRIRLYAQTEASKTSSPNDKEAIVLNNLLSLVKETEAGDITAEMALAKGLYNRLQYLRAEVFKNDKQALLSNPEYLMLMRMYLELTEKKRTQKLADKEMRIDEIWLRTQDRMSGRVQTYVYDIIDAALRRSKNQLLPFVEQNKQFVDLLNKTAQKLSIFKDNSESLFKPMFKTRKAKYNNEWVEVNTQEIHYDENDPETKAALANPNSGLTLTMVSYGKYIVESFQEEFAKYLANQNERIYLKGYYSKSDQEKADIIKERAMTDAKARMKPGMLPAITGRYTEALAKGDFREAFDKFFQNGLFQDSPFENYYQDKEDADGYYKLSSQFWSQFSSGDYYGGPQRLNLMGLTINESGELEVIDMKTQQGLTKNLENSFNYTMAASIRAREMKPAVQAINVANDYLSALQKQRGVNTNELQKSLDIYINRQIYGELPQTGEIALGGLIVNIDNTLGAFGQLTNLMHLSLAPFLAAKNALSASLKGALNATINTLADKITGNAVGFFGIENVSRAISLLSYNPKLVAAINKKHQIVSMGERDLISHFENVSTKKNLSDTDTAMLFHWYGEHYTQLIGALAQMDKEGVLGAYSLNDKGELVYDVKKDTRFYNLMGQKMPLADLLMRDIIHSQTREGVHNIGGNGVLLSPYSQGDENRIKVIVQRFVGEVTDNQLKNQLSAYALPRAIMSLRTYLYNTLQYFWKNPSVEPMLGTRKVAVGSTGKEEVVWDAPVAEGLIQTLVHTFKLIKNAAFAPASEQLSLNPYQKRNLVSAGVFTSVVLGLYYLIGHIIDADDEDKQSTLDLVTKWTIYGAVQEQLSNVNPIAPYTEIAEKPTVYIQQANNLIDVFRATLMFAPKYLGYTDENGVPLKELVADYAYKVSKNIPYATSYRNLHNLSISIWDDITGETTKNLK